jgi:D-alanyl-D-alanine carboxypeptidase
MLKRFACIVVTLLVFCVVVVLVVKPANSLLGHQLAPLARSTNALPAIDQSTSLLPTNDLSTLLLVNAQNPLPDNYHPQNLVSLYDQRTRYFELEAADITVCEQVYQAMDAMFAAAQRDGVGEYIITSGYRTHEEQRELYLQITDGTAARPGTSEHQTGLAFDVGAKGNDVFEQSAQYQWLYQHCAEYGFIIRYPQGMESVTGYPFEPWHYRYVGIEHATEIKDRGITLEQYCQELQQL